jgi:hypothetical protein
MKNNIILGIFLFGTSRVGEFLEKGFRFISVGNDLHHILTQSGAYVNDIEKVAKDKCATGWTRRSTALLWFMVRPQMARSYRRRELVGQRPARVHPGT